MHYDDNISVTTDEHGLPIVNKPQPSVKRLEYWDAVLHEHPVSEDYKSAHTGAHDFTPSGMVERENSMARWVEAARESLREAMRFSDKETRSLQELMKKLEVLISDMGDKEYADIIQLENLLKNDSTSLGELVEWYRKYNLEEVQHWLEMAHKEAGVLNDVMTGGASLSGGQNPTASGSTDPAYIVTPPVN
jgi:hypothetical protein